MSCKNCQPLRTLPRPAALTPCPSCVAEHLRRAQGVGDRLRDRYRAYWHLAQAAALAGEPLRGKITAARQAWQRDGAAPKWDRLVDAPINK